MEDRGRIYLPHLHQYDGEIYFKLLNYLKNCADSILPEYPLSDVAYSIPPFDRDHPKDWINLNYDDYVQRTEAGKYLKKYSEEFKEYEEKYLGIIYVANTTFTPEKYEKVKTYIKNCELNILPENPDGPFLTDDMPSIYVYDPDIHRINLKYRNDIHLSSAWSFLHTYAKEIREYDESTGILLIDDHSEFNPETFRKLERYIKNCSLNILPQNPDGTYLDDPSDNPDGRYMRDDFPTFSDWPSGDSQEYTINLSMANDVHLSAAKNYVYIYKEKFSEYQETERLKGRTKDEVFRDERRLARERTASLAQLDEAVSLAQERARVAAGNAALACAEMQASIQQLQRLQEQQQQKKNAAGGNNRRKSRLHYSKSINKRRVSKQQNRGSSKKL